MIYTLFFSSERASDLHNSAQKGNFEGAAAKLPELDVEGDLETQKKIFKYLSRPEKYAKRSCPICAVNNDGQCCHFVQEHGSLPALKICIKCGKVGEHRSWECPNVALRSDPVFNDKHSAAELESECAAANVPHQNQNQRAQLRRPAPESETEGAAAKRPALESGIKNQRAQGRSC